MNKNRKSNIAMRLASILFVCVMISTFILSGLLARYTTSGSGGDEARVIKFGDLTLTETGDFVYGTENQNVLNNKIIPGVNLVKDIAVDFGGSESATYVFVEMEIPGNWTATNNYQFSYNEIMKFSISSNEWIYLENSSYVYYKVLEPNISLIDVDVITNNGEITVSPFITKAMMKNLNDFSIKFQATVVQSNGFGSVAEAWASVSSKKGGN